MRAPPPSPVPCRTPSRARRWPARASSWSERSTTRTAPRRQLCHGRHPAGGLHGTRAAPRLRAGDTVVVPHSRGHRGGQAGALHAPPHARAVRDRRHARLLRSAASRVSPRRRRSRASSCETIPQIGEDIYRAVSRLPGVSADDFSAKFNVRGGSGDELYVSLDGLELVEPFHLQGRRRLVLDHRHPDARHRVAHHGRLLRRVRRSAHRRVHAPDEPIRAPIAMRTSLGVSVMNARATSQGGFAGGKGGWLVSVRPGYLDVALKLTEHPRLAPATLLRPVRQGAVRPRARRPRRAARAPRGRHLPLSAEGRAEHLSGTGATTRWLTWDDNVRLAPDACDSVRLDWRRSTGVATADESKDDASPATIISDAPVARSHRAATGLDVRRHAATDAQVGRRREARVGDVRLLQRRARARRARSDGIVRHDGGRHRSLAPTGSPCTSRRACSCFRRSPWRSGRGSIATRTSTSRS